MLLSMACGDTAGALIEAKGDWPLREQLQAAVVTQTELEVRIAGQFGPGVAGFGAKVAGVAIESGGQWHHASFSGCSGIMVDGANDATSCRILVESDLERVDAVGVRFSGQFIRRDDGTVVTECVGCAPWFASKTGSSSGRKGTTPAPQVDADAMDWLRLELSERSAPTERIVVDRASISLAGSKIGSGPRIDTWPNLVRVVERWVTEGVHTLPGPLPPQFRFDGTVSEPAGHALSLQFRPLGEGCTGLIDVTGSSGDHQQYSLTDLFDGDGWTRWHSGHRVDWTLQLGSSGCEGIELYASKVREWEAREGFWGYAKGATVSTDAPSFQVDGGILLPQGVGPALRSASIVPKSVAGRIGFGLPDRPRPPDVCVDVVGYYDWLEEVLCTDATVIIRPSGGRNSDCTLQLHGPIQGFEGVPDHPLGGARFRAPCDSPIGDGEIEPVGVLGCPDTREQEMARLCSAWTGGVSAVCADAIVNSVTANGTPLDEDCDLLPDFAERCVFGTCTGNSRSDCVDPISLQTTPRDTDGDGWWDGWEACQSPGRVDFFVEVETGPVTLDDPMLDVDIDDFTFSGPSTVDYMLELLITEGLDPELPGRVVNQANSWNDQMVCDGVTDGFRIDLLQVAPVWMSTAQRNQLDPLNIAFAPSWVGRLRDIHLASSASLTGRMLQNYPLFDSNTAAQRFLFDAVHTGV